jgi:uncharacterized lipoprotein YbaY
MMRLAWFLTALVVAAAAVGPAAAQYDARLNNVVRGEVTWFGPPPVESILQVFVFDFTDPQYPDIVADRAIANPLGSPVRFEIAVDPRRISPNRTYGVTARIIYGKPPQVAHENRQPHYVLTRGNPNTVSIRLNDVSANTLRPRDVDGQRRFWRGRIKGTVSFRDRQVPDGSILQVFLFDFTNPRAPFIVADQAIKNPQGSEAAFALRFDPNRIDPSRVYGVTARIIYGSPPSVLLSTRRAVYVLTRGKDDDDLELRLGRPAVQSGGPVVDGRRFPRGQITGTVSFRDWQVPDGAILQVFLFDLTDPRAPFIVVDQAIKNPQGSEAAFALRFDPNRIDPSRVYGVTARIIYGSPPSVLLSTSQPVYVLTRGADDDHLELRLRRP